MKVVGYVRVSTVEQVEGYGLDVQRKAIRAWAKANGHRLVAIYEDAGISGTTPLAERPGLTDAIDALRPPPVDTALVIPKLDRLARELKIQESILQTIWQSGAQVFSADSGEVPQDDPDDGMRTFFRQVIGGVNQLERSLIAKRMRDGRRQKAEQGRYAYGSPPFGYRAKGRELVPDTDEQAVIGRIGELYDAGSSLRETCQILESEGLKTKRGGVSWHPNGVRRVLARIDAASPA